MKASLTASPAATRISAEAARNGRRLPLAAICGLGVLMGIIGSVGAVVLRSLIGLVHNLLFLGRLDTFYDASILTSASP